MSPSIEDKKTADGATNHTVQRRTQLRHDLQNFRNDLHRETQTLRRDLRDFRCELKEQVAEFITDFRQNHRQTSRRLRSENQQYIYHVSKYTQSLRQRLRYSQLTGAPIDIDDADHTEIKDSDAGADGKSNAVTAEKSDKGAILAADETDSGPVTKEAATTTDDIWTVLAKEQLEHLLKQAVNVELQTFIDAHSDHRAEDGRQAVVRNGYLPARTIETDLGALKVRIPKTRDRSGQGIKFNSQLLPPYLKQTQSKRLPLVWCCWHGMAVGNFYPLLQNLLGIEDISDSDALSQATRERLETQWRQAYLKRCNSNWSNLHPDHLQATTIWQDVAQQRGPCCLVVIAIDDRNRKQVLAVDTGESAELTEWKSLITGLHEQGLRIPMSAVLSKSIGPRLFREALYNVFPQNGG